MQEMNAMYETVSLQIASFNPALSSAAGGSARPECAGYDMAHVCDVESGAEGETAPPDNRALHAHKSPKSRLVLGLATVFNVGFFGLGSGLPRRRPVSPAPPAHAPADTEAGGVANAEQLA